MKTLIVYYSASGVTKRRAEEISNQVGGDLYEIVPTEIYTNEDLDWTNNNSRSSVEMADKTSRPTIVNNPIDLNNYDKIVIGFPIWWGVAPHVVNTFIESNDLTNKELYVFVTSGTTPVESSIDDLKTTYPNLNFVNAIRIASESDIEEIKGWL